MEDFLTIEEIESRYAPEWVLIGEPQMDESLEVRAGRVLFHGLDRDAVGRKAAEYPPGRYAVLFLGTMPNDSALVL